MTKTIYVGLDVHKDSISTAVFNRKDKVPFEEKTILNEKNKIKKYFQRLKRHGEIVACYEAGCIGLELYRFLDDFGIKCLVISPGKLPRYSGDRVKTDKKDARKLGDLLRQGVLESIYIPPKQVESVREFIRLREDVRLDLLRWKQRLKAFLLRNDFRYEGPGKGWNNPYKQWLKKLSFDNEFQENTFNEHYQKIEDLQKKLNDIDDMIIAIGNTDYFAEDVAKLRCLKGIDYLTAVTIIAEIVDFNRFSTAQSFMSFLGIVPGEWSSGSKRHQTGITKTGSSHLRRLFTEAAWHYRYPYAQSKRVSDRRKGQPAEIISYADKCSKRLGKKYHKMTARGKSKQITVTAIGRELSGFVWGLMVGKTA